MLTSSYFLNLSCKGQKHDLELANTALKLVLNCACCALKDWYGGQVASCTACDERAEAGLLVA